MDRVATKKYQYVLKYKEHLYTNIHCKRSFHLETERKQQSGGPKLIGPTVLTKIYMFPSFYVQYLVLFTMPPVSSTYQRHANIKKSTHGRT